MFAFMYLKANFTEICEEISFPSFFQKNADVSIFVEIQGKISRKNEWLPQFFFVDSNSPFKDLLFPRGPNFAQKPLYLVGTVLKLCGQTVTCVDLRTKLTSTKVSGSCC